MADTPDLSDFHRIDDNAELRRVIVGLEQRLRKAKAKTDELVAATVQAAHDAMVTLGPLPPVPAPAGDRRKGRPQVALLHATDWQGSKVTASYNTDVMRERVLTFVDKSLEITDVQRAHHPVKECVILFGGDLIEGLFNYPTQPFEIDQTLFGQYARTARLVVEVVRRALANFERVTVVGEWGNHGRIGNKRSAVPAADNVDRMIYELARSILSDPETGRLHPRLTWEDCPDDIQRVQIGNYRALLIHGDEIGRNGYASITTLVSHVARWQSGSYPWEFTDLYCVDPETEALTPNGWRRYDQIGGSPIATMNPDTGLFEWQTPSRILVKQHDGYLVHHRGRSMDHLATPDHDMWVRHHGGSWGRRKADEVPASTNWLYRSSSDGWAGGKIDVELPGCLEGADWGDIAELVGWHVAEGSACDHQVSIAQDRDVKATYHERIVALVRRLGFHASTQKGAVRICNSELARWIRVQCGVGAASKRIPAWAKDLPAPLLERLLEAACLGDGSAMYSVNGRKLVHYYTVSDQLADDIQEIALKLGYATMKRIRKPRGFGNLDCHEISLARSPVRRMAKTREDVPYSGLVWCPTVDNGLWFMRRNGRVMVTGNCGHRHNHLELPLPNGRGSIYQTGATESDNRYARDLMAAASTPSQRLHFIDPDKGRVVSTYKVWLDA